MTRFARSKGSNAYNQKVPHDATSWSQMQSLSSSKPLINGDQPKQVVKIKWKMKQMEENPDILGSPMNESSTEINEDSIKNIKRKKPSSDSSSFIKDDVASTVRFEGFPVRREDAIRLKELKKKLLASKIPHHEIKRTMQLERRRAEKALSREKKQVCFHCRQSGHILSQCPNLNNETDLISESGICFKCGSTEHQHTQCRVVRGDNYKFATCFICKQEGHISKQCPDNPRGLYPEGGNCRVCGDVTHLKKDCPRFSKKKKTFEVTLSTMDSSKLELLDEDNSEMNRTNIKTSPKKKRKIIKM